MHDRSEWYASSTRPIEARAANPCAKVRERNNAQKKIFGASNWSYLSQFQKMTELVAARLRVTGLACAAGAGL